MLAYSANRKITPDQFRELLVRSTLGERRPLDDAAAIQAMVEHANLMVTCWEGDRLVGAARSLTDFLYCCYLADLAVDRDFQRQGIGQKLIALTHGQLGPNARIILLAAPAAADYYAPLGFEYNPRAWMQGKDQIKSLNNSDKNL